MKKQTPTHFLKWLYIFSLTLFPMEANSVEIWELSLPNNQTFVVLFLWLLGFIILGFSLYRVLLKNQVRQDVHPHILSHTLILLCTGGYLLVLFLYLLDQIGLGWFAVIGSIYLFVLLMMVFLGNVLRPIIFFLVIMLAIIAFRLVDM
jgi:membrane-associated HD superfamily phosphohydrolase